MDCFAQLVGTVLSIWDSEALDAAGPEGNATPSFINLADASIKMVYSLLLLLQTSVRCFANILLLLLKPYIK